MKGMAEEAVAQARAAPERELILAGEFAIVTLYLNAYLPLAAVNGKFVIAYASLPFILQSFFNLFFILITSTAVVAVILTYRVELNGIIGTIGVTENLVMSSVSGVNWAFCLYCRITAFSKRRATLEFWTRNVQLFTAFETASSTIGPTNLMTNLRVSLKRNAVILILSVLCFATMVTIFSCMSLAKPEVKHTWNVWILLLSIEAYFIIVFLHTGHGIWISFFLQLYASLFHVLESRLCSLITFSEDGPRVQSNFENQQLRDELRECYRLYWKITERVKDFNLHFGWFLVGDCLFGLLNVVVFIYFAIHWAIAPNLEMAAVFAFGVVIYGKHFYSIGTVGSQLTRAADGVMDQLNKLYASENIFFGSGIRRELQMLVFLISGNSPNVDAAQYFTLNRNMNKVVTKFPQSVLGKDITVGAAC